MDAWVILGIDCSSSTDTITTSSSISNNNTHRNTAATPAPTTPNFATSDINQRTPFTAASITPAATATTNNNDDNKLSSIQPPPSFQPLSSIPESMESIIYNWRAQAEDSMRAAGKTAMTNNQVSVCVYMRIYVYVSICANMYVSILYFPSSCMQ